MKKTLIALSSAVIFTLSSANTEIKSEILQDNFQVTLEWLEQKPKSYSRDFFIIQYLNQNDISLEEAKKAYDMAHKKTRYIKDAYKKYNKIKASNLECYQASINELLKMNNEKCIALGLSLKEATQIPKAKLAKFIEKIENYPTLKKDLNIIYNKDIGSESLNYGYDNFFKFFFKLGTSYRYKNFDNNYSEEFINKLATQKQFEMLVRYTIYKKNRLQNLQKSLLNTKNNKDLTPNVLFLLGINAVNHNNDEKAYYFFENAFKKSYLRSDKDKALFWLYLVTDNKTFLHELSKSFHINLYSAYAKELLEVPLENIYYDIEIPNTPTKYDIYDQFSWMKVLDDTKKNLDENKLKKYETIFTNENTKPHLAFVLTRFHKYRNHYFITPFKDIVKDYSTYKKVLLYSIAKQESLFIPSSISFSTAQGVMQIMPFLSETIANKLNENYNIYDQFNPEVNIKYGSYHLETLMKQFNNNPLFIAYAYNGGAGYTKSQFKQGLFKRIDKKYEPFLSMEMISYPETKEYGKKVLTNYYVYNNYLNPKNKVRLSTIFQTLVAP
jgi:soluble lytic murein transglycosylase